MRIHPLILLLSCAFATAAGAQNPVLRPGSQVLAADFIADRFEGFEVYTADRAGVLHLAGLKFLHTRRALVNGTEAIARTDVLILDSLVVVMDSIVLDRLSLAPLLGRFWAHGAWRTLDFSAGQARYVPHPGVRPEETRLVAPVFVTYATDLLLNALPLGEGYAVNLAVYEPYDGLSTLVVRVEGEEDVVLPSDDTVPAWRVHVDTDDGPVTYWMDRESRTLVQLEKARGAYRMVRSRPPHFGAPDPRSTRESP